MSLLLWLLAFIGDFVALGSQVQDLVRAFEGRYRAAHVLEARFLERYSESGHLLRTESGTAYFRRPWKMRLEYEAPEKNLFLVDGKTAWFYVPEDHTVTRVPAKQSADWRTPLALLAGEMKLSRICARVELADETKPELDGDVVLSCRLKGSDTKPVQGVGREAGRSSKDIVILEVNEATGVLVRVVVPESGGVGIEFKFNDWRFDPPVPDSFFRFEVPPGVAIVNSELPSESKSIK